MRSAFLDHIEVSVVLWERRGWRAELMPVSQSCMEYSSVLKTAIRTYDESSIDVEYKYFKIFECL